MIGVFLSHSSTDKNFAKRLGGDLQRHGIKVWVDEAEIKIGDSLIEKISKGIEETDYLIVLLSKCSCKSEWVKKEVNIALNMEILNRRVYVLPCLLERCKMPLFLIDKKYADFSKTYKTGLDQIIETLLPGTNGLQTQLESIKCDFYVNITSIDGKYAKISKSQIIICNRGSIDHYVEDFSCTGEISNMNSKPGFVEKVWEEGGRTFVKCSFQFDLKEGQTLTRKFSYIAKDTFHDDENYYEIRHHHPTDSFSILVLFPKQRPPKKWFAHERRGVDKFNKDDIIQLFKYRSRPALKLSGQNPKLLSTHVLSWYW